VCAASLCQPRVLGSHSPSHIAVDSTGIYLAGSFGGTGGVYRMPREGGAAAPLFSTSDDFTWALQLDELHAYSFVRGDDHGELYRVSKSAADGGREVIASGYELLYPTGLALDDGAQFFSLYFGQDSVLCLNCGGDGGVRVLARNQPAPITLQVDSTWVYWVNSGYPSTSTSSGAGKTLRDGSGSPITLASGQSGCEHSALDSSHFYWTCPGSGQIFRSRVGNGGVTEVFHQATAPNAILLDPAGIYFGETFPDGGGRVAMLGYDGGNERTLASTRGTGRMAQTADGIYYLSALEDGGSGVWVIAKP